MIQTMNVQRRRKCSYIKSIPPEGNIKRPYLGCFGLADSQSFSEVGIYSVISFPFSLGWLDPVGNNLDCKVRGSKVRSQRLIAQNKVIIFRIGYLFLLSVIFPFECVHAAVLCIHGEVPQRAFAQRGHLLSHLHRLQQRHTQQTTFHCRKWRMEERRLGVLDAETHLPFTSLQDRNNVVICDLALFGSKHVCGSVTDDGQHLILSQLVGAWIHKSSC